MQSLLHTFLELGDAVSRNLAFAHSNHGKLIYGEETITETNLLEILRKHANRGTHLTAISKGKEAKSGADWEWVVVGKRYSFFMRVQAKRTNRFNKLKIKHSVGQWPNAKQQIDILIANCAASFPGDVTWRPLYCFYSKNSERVRWKSVDPDASNRIYQYGCLIADANRVKGKVSIKTIKDVEDISVPWHIFFAPARFKGRYAILEVMPDASGTVALFAQAIFASAADDKPDDDVVSSDFPTVEQLNGDDPVDESTPGLRETNSEEIERVKTRSRVVGVDAPRFLILDVTEEPRRSR